MTLQAILQFITIPGSILCWPKLLPLDKILFGLLRFCQNKKDHAWANPETWAGWLGCDARTIRASVKRLVKMGCLTIEQVDGRTAYRVLSVKDSFYLRVTIGILARTDLTFAERLGLALISFNTCGNEDHHGWAGQDKLADWLGCSRRSVIRIIDGLKTKGLIEVRRRGPRSNQYSLTPAGEAAIVAHHPGKRCDNFARPYKTSENESSKEPKETDTKRTPPATENAVSCLSSPLAADQEAAKAALEAIGIRKATAAELAQRSSKNSVHQAIANAQAVQQHSRPGFNLPGYVVSTLRTAAKEGHEVRASKLAKQEARKAQTAALKARQRPTISDTDAGFREGHVPQTAEQREEARQRLRNRVARQRGDHPSLDVASLAAAKEELARINAAFKEWRATG